MRITSDREKGVRMFHFVTVERPGALEEKTKRKMIRQHAIRNGIQNKKNELVRRKENFVTEEIDTCTGKPVRHNQRTDTVSLVKTLSGSRLDPFNTLPGDGEQLRMLMGHKATSPTEPAFCVKEAREVYLKGTDHIFKNTSSDPDFFHALSLVLTLAAKRNIPKLQFLQYKGATLRDLTMRMSHTEMIPSLSTLTAMLLVIGYEYRTDGTSAESIGLHVRAVQDVLKLLETNNFNIVDHNDYRTHNCSSAKYEVEDLSKFRDLSAPSGFFTLIPSGSNFGLILNDVNALCAMIDSYCAFGKLPTQELSIEDHQWTLTSRTVDLLDAARKHGPKDSIHEACIIATLLCLYKLSTGVWEGCFIPEYLTTQIMGLVSQARDDSRWEAQHDLLLWLLFVGGALSKRIANRKRAMSLFLIDFHEVLNGIYGDCEQLGVFLKRFIWCGTSMDEPVRQFWDELRRYRQTLESNPPKIF
ncbi:hypothetical protein CC80DRAFT_592728 [Byssothecium circinans]|uniref:Uncharacterized protein n=1 Tax=Byssothecium circinans TaxID=147558 RepID=A0A6A5TYF2_9PLEO|nr:hypothetical protein CC80DRAFT_592728 [Byssothecium circinans]